MTQCIPAKAYLGDRTTTSLVIADEITAIGDWAFAHMKELRSIMFPKKEITFGKEIFLGCEKLETVYVVTTEKEQVDARINLQEEKAARLLAKLLMTLSCQELLTPECVGETAWYTKADEKITAYLSQADEAGFSPVFFGGEEDYEEDVRSSQELFVKTVCQKKVELLLCRLEDKNGLGDAQKSFYEHCLLERFIHQKETFWEVLVKNSQKRMEGFSIFLQAGCVNEKTKEWVSQQESALPMEARAMLLQYQLAHFNRENDFTL